VTTPTLPSKRRKGAHITRGGSVTQAPENSNLTEVLDLILDKGIVVDAYVRVSVIGIELTTIDARVAPAPVDTYLRLAEAVTRLDFEEPEKPMTLEDLP
jgi:gas vesicle structural protein